MKYLLVSAFALLLSGCPLDGPSGEQGTQGQAGSQGLAGLSCWDLNENGIKDSAEDSNKDGAVDVWDCRTAVGVAGNHRDAPNENEFSPIHLGRQMHVSNGFVSSQHRITMYSGTQADSWVADDAFQEALLVDPIDDTCGLWKWKPALDRVGSVVPDYFVLQPENAVAYASFPLQVTSQDSAGNTMYGWQACVTSCLDDLNCTGVAYVSDETLWQHSTTADPNGMHCFLLRDVGREIGDAFEFTLFETPNKGALAAALTYDQSHLEQGIASVCAAP
ncbi:TPA: hypothetical protein RQJ99_002590 [Vibrio vulnificus]|nr:hypothetical protein [Vibrio vulnificus]HDY7424930.1 hypothetical protein [Vibrio vulnificus]HDY7497708.1 hypothetical protein [Vibrio vulnificus]HDY7498656.1 hypothetical protein [Vibrio vulnificus]HDY7660652.1 hypothetical protein [Vibrio vulnificus]